MKVTFNWYLKETASLEYPNIKWGAWGGGWNYKLGLAVSSTSLLIELLVLGITLYWGKDED